MSLRSGKLPSLGSEDEFLDHRASLAKLDGAPQDFTNLMSIVVADAARRYGNTQAAVAAARVCTNSQLLFLWDRWTKWKKAPSSELGQARLEKKKVHK